MLQGFFLLARRQARQRAAALLIFLLLAAVMLVLAVRAVRAPAAVPADAASLVAGTDGTHLTISQNGEVILTTAIDVRTLPSADRAALCIESDSPDTARRFEALVRDGERRVETQPGGRA